MCYNNSIYITYSLLMVLFYIFCWEQYSSSNALLYASWKSGFNFLMYLYHCCQNWNQSACKYIEILCLKQNSICSRTVREMFARCSRDVREVREHVRQFEECSSRVSFVNSIFANKKSVRELYEHMFVNKSRFGSHVWI